MNKTIDTAAIESLRTFALAHNEIEFAHLCTAALNDEAWAVEKVTEALDLIACDDEDEINPEWARMRAINATDCSRPDGAIARKLEDV